MHSIAMLIVGAAVSGLAAWGIVSIVDPRPRLERSIESDREELGRRTIRLISLLLAFGLILATLLVFVR